MSEIGTISLERLNNGAHFLFISNVLARAEADANVKSKLSAQIDSLKKAKEQEDVDLKISQKSLLTDDIAKADAERDELYNGYKKAVNSYKSLPVENMAKAAKVLMQHIKDYAIDPKMQLDKETGLLINFIDDLEKKYVEEVKTLALSAFVTALKAANEKVRTLTTTRTEERMTKAIGALKASRKASDEAFRQLVKYVNAYALIEGDSKYLNFIDYVNVEVTHFKRQVIKQKSTAADTSGGSTTGGSTTGGSTTGGSTTGGSTTGGSTTGGSTTGGSTTGGSTTGGSTTGGSTTGGSTAGGSTTGSDGDDGTEG